jgi:hypothetical protein
VILHSLSLVHLSAASTTSSIRSGFAASFIGVRTFLSR